MITHAMIDAAARGLYETTTTYKRLHIEYDLLPRSVQEEMRRLARAALDAAAAAEVKPES